MECKYILILYQQISNQNRGITSFILIVYFEINNVQMRRYPTVFFGNVLYTTRRSIKVVWTKIGREGIRWHVIRDDDSNNIHLYIRNIYIALKEENVLFQILVTDKFVQRERNVIYTLNVMKIYQYGGSYIYIQNYIPIVRPEK